MYQDNTCVERATITSRFPLSRGRKLEFRHIWTELANEVMYGIGKHSLILVEKSRVSQHLGNCYESSWGLDQRLEQCKIETK